MPKKKSSKSPTVAKKTRRVRSDTKTGSRQAAAKKTSKSVAAVVERVVRPYDLTIIVSPTVKAEKRSDVVDKVKKLVEKSQGKVEKSDEWGLKDLAYPIAKQRTGWYVNLSIKTPPDQITQIDEAIRRSDEIIRHLLIKI